MAGLLNHPKMPLLAGGLTLLLLGGGMYLTLDDEAGQPLAAQSVQQAPSGRPTGTAGAARPRPIPAPAVSAMAPRGAPLPVSSPSAASALADAPSTLTAAPPGADRPPVAMTSPTLQAQATPAPVVPAPFPEPVAKPAPSIPTRKQAEVRHTSHRVTGPSPLAAQRRAAPTPSVRKETSPNAATRHEVLPSEPTPKAKAASEQAEPSQDKTRDYTEIKVTAPNPNLAPARGRSEVGTPAGPVLVMTAGGKAWVRVSPTRTIVVKPGEEVPDMGKVLSVNPTDIVTDKGKLNLPKE